MKTLIQIFTLLLLGCASQPSQVSNSLPSGVYYPDVKRSMAWMLENRYSGKVGAEAEDIARKLREALYEGELLRHSWENGQLEAGVGDWNQPYSREWEEIGPGLFRSIKPADESNTELITLLKITSEDTYFIEITVNGVLTREYWVRKHDS
ncbi:MAG: hypothetical protein JJU29_17945 [Verrucomicrobia bacterium]|nr:hypothetical protein [Verrucomicrobiota bacterium]MCH8514462.1 hypothetical protein [Kiritimatiellia bacterium]